MSDPFSQHLPRGLTLVPARQLVVAAPTIRIFLGPGDVALVSPGEAVLPGTPIAERTPDAALVDVGALETPDEPPEPATEPGRVAPVAGVAESMLGREQPTAAAEPVALAAGPGPDHPDRRRPPVPGKPWVGGERRRGRLGRHYISRRVAGTLLFESGGRWHAAAGERHEILEAPVAGIVREARNGVGITVTTSGSGIPGAFSVGGIARGPLDVPSLAEGDLRATSLDVGRTGTIVVTGGRVDAEALSRARAMAIRGLIAASVTSGDLRDLAASEARQRASLHALPPFAVLGLDGHLRRPLAAPVLALLRSLAGRDVAIVGDPPMLLFDGAEIALPDFPPDWVRVRSGAMAGREGRWIGSAGIRRFRAGVHLEAAFVRLEDEQVVVPVNDLERYVY